MIRQTILLAIMILVVVSLSNLEIPDYFTKINMPISMLITINPTQVIEESTIPNYLEVESHNSWIQSAGIVP